MRTNKRLKNKQYRVGMFGVLMGRLQELKIKIRELKLSEDEVVKQKYLVRISWKYFAIAIAMLVGGLAMIGVGVPNFDGASLFSDDVLNIATAFASAGIAFGAYLCVYGLAFAFVSLACLTGQFQVKTTLASVIATIVQLLSIVAVISVAVVLYVKFWQ